MPTVSKRWDIQSLIEYHAHVQTTGDSIVRGVREVHSNCPWCPGSDDSFVMRPETGQYSHAIRSGGCGRSGDALDFLKEYVGMTHQEAVEELGLEDTPFAHEKLENRQLNSKDTAPSKKWMEHAEGIVWATERCLWGAKGKEALAYLRGRGLRDETIIKARLGYMPLRDDGKFFYEEFEEWGFDREKMTEAQLAKENVKIGNGIVIPWFVGGEIWKLAVKRPGDTKVPYGQVMGSSEPLYNVDTLQYGEVAMMVEGELDCLSVVQEASDLVNCVATGSKDKGRSGRWIAELSLASFILQSFDEDEPGDAGAQYWLDLWNVPLSAPKGTPGKIERWSPMDWNDPNDLLQAQIKGETDGFTLREWVQLGVDITKVAMNVDLQFPTLARDVQASVNEHFDAEEEEELVYEPF